MCKALGGRGAIGAHSHLRFVGNHQDNRRLSRVGLNKSQFFIKNNKTLNSKKIVSQTLHDKHSFANLSSQATNNIVILQNH